MAMASAQRYWTLEELHALPDDGNKYELIHGELFVSPSPAPRHEGILSRLHEILIPYVKREKLGRVLARGTVRRPASSSEVEPDLTVLQLDVNLKWEEMPVPSLVVEAHSPRSRAYDSGKKRDFYLEQVIPEYWMIDGERRTITIVRPGESDRIVSEMMTWHPPAANEPLVFSVAELFV